MSMPGAWRGRAGDLRIWAEAEDGTAMGSYAKAEDGTAMGARTSLEAQTACDVAVNTSLAALLRREPLELQGIPPKEYLQTILKECEASWASCACALQACSCAKKFDVQDYCCP